MRLGVLDIGSNSAQLQVVDVRAGAPPLPAHCVKEPTLLGEAIDPDGSIDQAGVAGVVPWVWRCGSGAAGLLLPLRPLRSGTAGSLRPLAGTSRRSVPDR